jgi:hypothetical protein
MSFHVVHHEHSTIFVLNQQTYETYRFNIGADLAFARVDTHTDLARARQTAIAFLVQSAKENAPHGVPEPASHLPGQSDRRHRVAD